MSESPPPRELNYQSSLPEAAGHRPIWVWIVVAIYILLVSTVILLPLWVLLFGETAALAPATIVAAGLTLCGLGLLFTPVRRSRGRSMSRRSIWIPILSAATLLALLVLAAGVAMDEYLFAEPDSISFDSNHSSPSIDRVNNERLWANGVYIATAGVWIGWGALFVLISRKRSPDRIASRMHQWILAGSLAELLVAVPTHIIVRRRGACCAGIMTGTAICVGVVVMIIAFGPSVFLLYHRRRKQIKQG